jgi:hypothetical protein
MQYSLPGEEDLETKMKYSLPGEEDLEAKMQYSLPGEEDLEAKMQYSLPGEDKDGNSVADEPENADPVEQHPRYPELEDGVVHLIRRRVLQRVFIVIIA